MNKILTKKVAKLLNSVNYILDFIPDIQTHHYFAKFVWITCDQVFSNVVVDIEIFSC